jgi:hypothetical protein
MAVYDGIIRRLIIELFIEAQMSLKLGHEYAIRQLYSLLEILDQGLSERRANIWRPFGPQGYNFPSTGGKELPGIYVRFCWSSSSITTIK